MKSKKYYLSQLLGSHFTAGNTVELLQNGDEIFPSMLEAIHGSQNNIEFLTYIYWSGKVANEFAEALSKKSKQGVEVRVLLDAFGSKEIDHKLIDQMREAGVEVEWFRKIGKAGFRIDYRTHRKILVCDGNIGFTGGVGIAQEWEGDAQNENEWRETHFRLTGPAVTELRGAFWDNWIETDHAPPRELVALNDEPRQDGPDALQVIRSDSGKSVADAYKAVSAIVDLADKNLSIITPYFVPDEALAKRICDRAKKGVSVRLLLPGNYIDRRFERKEGERLYDQLLAAGVRIFRYQTSMIHTKLMLCDEDLALFGSVNLNRRSMEKDNEILVISASVELNKQLKKSFSLDLERSKEVTTENWKGVGPWDGLMNLLRTPFRKQL